jgi:general secretion pathway protein G
MTRTSGSCLHASRRRGFTLLELLIVLGIIATATALVAPRLQSTYEAIVATGERAEVRRALERLPLLARAQGAALAFPGTEAGGRALMGVLDLPEGWTLRPIDPVRVRASGVCASSRIEVAGRQLRETWVLDAPLCRVHDGAGG